MALLGCFEVEKLAVHDAGYERRSAGELRGQHRLAASRTSFSTHSTSFWCSLPPRSSLLKRRAAQL